MGALIEESKIIAVASSETVSASFSIPAWAIFTGMYFPDMDAGAIGLAVSIDGTNFYPVLDPVDGIDLVLCASGSDPGLLDISDFVRFIQSSWLVRITCAAQTSGAVDLTVGFRG